MQGDQFNQQQRNFDPFYGPTLVISQSIIGSENNSDGGMNFSYSIDRYRQANVESILGFRHLTKNNILQASITQRNFVTSNGSPEIIPGFSLNVFDVRDHQSFCFSQHTKVRVDSRPAFEATTK